MYDLYPEKDYFTWKFINKRYNVKQKCNIC